MKVKIEFEVNAPTSKLLKCLYDRLDILHQDLTRMDSNFKDIELTITTHNNKIFKGNPHINFHKPLPPEVFLAVHESIIPEDTKKAVIKILLNSLYGSKASTSYGKLCDMYHNGTCWGTRDREKCTCEGFKSFCTHYPKGE